MVEVLRCDVVLSREGGLHEESTSRDMRDQSFRHFHFITTLYTTLWEYFGSEHLFNTSRLTRDIVDCLTRKLKQ